MEEVNRLVREENRRRTPEERLARVFSLMAARGVFAPVQSGPEDSLTIAQLRWYRATEALRERA